MVKSVRLRNFKSHEDTYIELSPGLTTLVGFSDHGKTNIASALEIALENKDCPESFIREGQKETTITVVLDQGVIERKRVRNSQTVDIVPNKGKPRHIEGVDAAKEPIEEFTGLRKVTYDLSSGPEDVHFVGVGEFLYIIGSRPDVVRRRIAGIVGSNDLEVALSSLNKKLNSKRRELSVKAGVLSERERIFNDLSEKRDKLKDLIGKIQPIEEEIESVQRNLNKIRDLNDRLKDSNEILSSQGFILLEEKVYKVKELISKTKETVEIAQKSKAYDNCLKALSVVSTKADRVGLAVRIIEKALTELKKASTVVEKGKLLVDCSERISELTKNFETSEADKKEAAIKIRKILEETGECPVCGSKIVSR